MNAVDPSTAKWIDVIRGPASLLYGNNATGGVVNVISSDIPTSIPGRATGYVLGQGESVTPAGVANAGITVPIGTQFVVTARGGFRQFENRCGVSPDGLRIRPAASDGRGSHSYGTQFTLNTQTVNVTARTQVGRMTGAVGLQGLFREYAPAGAEAFVPSSTNNNVAAFLFQELPLSRGASEDHTPRLQIDARSDRFAIATDPGKEAARFGVAQSRSFDNLAASIGLSVPVTTDMSFTANMSRGFRAPAVEELFANGFHAAVGTFDVGNAAREPEQSTGFEAGLRAQTPRTFAQYNTYYNLIDKYILPSAIGTRNVDGNSVPLVNFLQRDAALYGAEGQVETKLVHRLVHRLVVGVIGERRRPRRGDQRVHDARPERLLAVHCEGQPGPLGHDACRQCIGRAVPRPDQPDQELCVQSGTECERGVQAAVPADRLLQTP